MLKKRLISMLLSFAMIAQAGFVAMAAGEEVLFDLKLDEIPAGPMSVYKMNLTDNATMTVIEQDGDKFVKVADNDSNIAGGFVKGGIPLESTITVSVDFRPIMGTVNFYMQSSGNPVSIVLGSVISYYTTKTGGNVKTEATLKSGNWHNITVILDPVSKTFDIYKNGLVAAENVPFREGGEFAKTFNLILYPGSASTATEFDYKNFRVVKGEVIPPVTEKIPPKADRTLVDYANAPTRLDEVLGNAVAMSLGNSMARVNNGYVHIDPDNKYVAPFVTEDGYTLIPTRFTTETIGCDVEVLSATSFRFSKDGTTMEINMGDKNAIINGVPKEMPTTPVIKNDRLLIPLRFAAETFGKNVFWDDRGLIIISDGEVVKAGQEDIIKPLLNQIRQYTTLYGNRKYSDVNFTSRYFRTDGHTEGTDTPQWGTLDAAKRFMATIDRWSYVISGKQVESIIDQGILVQGTLNANFTDGSKKVASYFLDGTPYTRADGVWGSMWACLSDPDYYKHIWGRAKAGMDAGLFSWQFDDWPLNAAYRMGGCFCDYCMADFAKYLSTEVSAEKLLEAEIGDAANFNFKNYLTSIGITKAEQFSMVSGKPIGKLWSDFNIYRVKQFHTRLINDMEEYLGEEVYYSFNASDTLNSITSSYIYSIVDGVMGETGAALTSADAIYGTMLFTKALDVENVPSPLPKNEGAKQLMYSAIPMCYATGQYMLVPWDDWLFGSTRYYCTLEELGHSYELPREYPYLFDNYEIPEYIGYVYDLSKAKPAADGQKFLDSSMPARIIANAPASGITFDANDFKGLQALVAGTDLSSLTAEEKALIENSGVTFVESDDAASLEYLQNAYWMTKNNTENVYTILRQNQLYDNAPTVVHAVSYNTASLEDVEVEINNLYLPAGDTLSVNVYRPGRNMETITVRKGQGSTKVTIDSMDLWTVLEISGPGTVRREASFYLGENLNGIGMGTRVSKDKLYGTEDDFTIVTYGEGINSTTFDDKGSQDEAAFVYSRLGKGIFRQASVSAGFPSADGAYGVMMREGVYSNARFVALMYDAENGLRIAKRENANEGVVYTEISKDKPAYMKIQRNGKIYEVYTSADGENYTKVGETEIVFDETIGGVFASSPDGSRAQCRVTDFVADKGSFPAGGFDEFRISVPGGSVSRIDFDKKLNIQLSAGEFTNLTVEDVNITFKSSDENVAKILADGTIVPVGEGTTTVTATAAMGLRKITTTTKVNVTKANPTMYEESFDEGKLPADYKRISMGKVEVKDDVLRLTSDTVGADVDASFGFTQYNMPTAFEFDFRANFGKTSSSVGARVAYIHTMAMSLTADVNGFQWFYGGTQTKVMDIEQNKWYKIRIEADYENQLASVYIDGKLVVDKGECRSPITPDGAVRIGGWRLGTDTVFEWDNFKFTIK